MNVNFIINKTIYMQDILFIDRDFHATALYKFQPQSRRGIHSRGALVVCRVPEVNGTPRVNPHTEYIHVDPR